MRRHPIGHDKTLEAHHSLQVVAEDGVILACVRAVHLVVRAHDCSCASLDRCLKGWVVELPGRPLVHSGVHMIAVGLLLVEGKVLHHRHDTLALHGSDEDVCEARPEVGVLAGKVLEVPAATCNALDIYRWAKHHVCTLATELLPNGRRNSRHQALVPGRSQGQYTRPLCCGASLVRVRCTEAVVGILHLQCGDSQASDGVSVAHVVAWDRVGSGSGRVGPETTDQRVRLISGKQACGPDCFLVRVLPRPKAALI
mmetsp:Transcript_56192/g.130883  ORF Transcript_56192/g.130883 Transcript_56192/m.130883 type:complete len:255 (-) Transcript_56192:380-1144(-)